MNWTAEQQAIIDEFRDGSSENYGHFIVRARAGTGKTTTIFGGVATAPERKILVAAFNKKIAEEGKRRNTNPATEVATLHSVGLRVVKKFWPSVGVNFNSERSDALVEEVCGSRAPDAIKRLISKLQTKGREIAPHAVQVGDLTDLALRFDCEPGEEWEDSGFDLTYVEDKALTCMDLAARVKPPVIDGSDMIFLPIRNKWLRPIYDMVVVDEAQDMTNAQLEIALKSCRKRVVPVGDDRQAIYAFRGADSNSLDRLKSELRAKEFPMTMTFRCGITIVNFAKLLVSDFQAGPDNHEGQISECPIEDVIKRAGPGDFVVSRLNAPLVPLALRLLKAGKRCRVNGRDIGQGLRTVLNRLTNRRPPKSIVELVERIQGWQEHEVAKLMRAKRDSSFIDMINDKADMLLALTEDVDSLDEVYQRVESLFTDDGLGDKGLTLLSSVHKIKGLEADRVFVLKDTLRLNSHLEEQNIAYVAYTRAKQELVLVGGGV